ncbi:hypothetical protein [uncultured Erythrobacter sp.]|uniref:hypothetical protein n=1 Tax=uncultured Erythrobacter sp. TaxID=263913 RepID=UPI00261071FF|nr:hypothetical protein [uncultured Erythrobacter sp.]
MISSIVSRVSPELVPIAHYVALWGISDDDERQKFLDGVSQEVRENFRAIIEQFCDEIDDWMIAHEALTEKDRTVYGAFVNMLMAADSL